VKKTSITIVSNKIEKKTTNTKYQKNVLALLVQDDAHQRLPHQVSLPPSIVDHI